MKILAIIYILSLVINIIILTAILLTNDTVDEYIWKGSKIENKRMATNILFVLVLLLPIFNTIGTIKFITAFFE